MCLIRSQNTTRNVGADSTGALARVGMLLADWSQKWFPDAFVFALAGLVIVFCAGLLVGTGTRNLVKYLRGWLLEPDSVHHADGNDNHWWIRCRRRLPCRN